MGIISVYVVNKAGGLIFSHDQPSPNADVEATFSYPLGMVLEEVDRNIVVKFGEMHGIQGRELCLTLVSLVTNLTRPSTRTIHKKLLRSVSD